MKTMIYVVWKPVVKAEEADARRSFSPPAPVETIGFLTGETDDYLALAQEYGLGMYRDIIAIPKSTILDAFQLIGHQPFDWKDNDVRS